MTQFADVALFPLFAIQALWVVARAERLPEPPGPRSGVGGDGPDLRLLILGDSSAAGVGAERQEDALSGQLARVLCPHVRLHWQLEAATGATTASAAARLATLPRQPIDAALVVLGANDVTRLSDLSRVLERRIEIANRLREDFGASNVVMTGVPPMGVFPLLPQPLRGRLGQRAARLDRALTEAAPQAGFQYLPFTLPFRPDYMARDGFHPAPLAYRVWAETLGPHLLPGPSALP